LQKKIGSHDMKQTWFLNNHCRECVRAYLSIHDCLSFLHKVMIGFPTTRNLQIRACLSFSPFSWRLINFRLFCSDDCRSWPREEKFWSNDCRSWPREKKINNHGCWVYCIFRVYHKRIIAKNKLVHTTWNRHIPQ
jgi:hypothetical protein